MKNEIAKPRILWLDALKGLAIISVVLGHALLGFEQKNSYPSAMTGISFLKDWIYTWHMPLFFVLSGIAFRISCLKAETFPAAKLKRTTLNLLIIYLIFESALPILKMIFSSFVNNPVQSSELLGMILLPTTPMWYLWVLIIYEWFFCWLFYQKPKLSVLMIILLILSCFGNTLYETGTLTRLCLKNLLTCAVFFNAGIYYKELKTLLFRKAALITAGIIAFSAIFYMIYSYFIIGTKYIWVTVLFLLEANACAVSLLLIFAFEKISTLGNNRFLMLMGKNSLAIYLLHTYFVTAMRVVIVKIGIQNAVLAVLLATVIPLGITYAAGVLIPKIPVVCYLFKPIALIEKNKQKKAA